MEAVKAAINELRNDLYNFANLVLTAVDQLAQAAVGGDNEAIQGYNNYYHKMQNSMGTIQNGIYQAQHQGLLNQLQPLFDNVNGLVMDCQNVATSGYLDEATKNTIVGKYQQVDQFLQQCLTLAVPEGPQVRPQFLVPFGAVAEILFRLVLSSRQYKHTPGSGPLL
jgi:methionyl-tRNA synthetase